MKPRTLVLKREALAAIDDCGLVGVVGGVTNTCYSCLDYISCYIHQCLIDRLPKTAVCPE